MKTLRNSFHRTQTRTRSTLSWDEICDEVYHIRRDLTRYHTRHDRNMLALYRRVKLALCGSIDCKCGTVR